MSLRSGTRRIAAAGIGLVTTAPSARGQGRASALVWACVERARDEGCELALLFAPPRGLYTRAGFVPAGRERIVRLDPDASADDKCVQVAGPADAFRLAPLLERHEVRVQRSVADFERLLRIPRTRLWVTRRGEHPLAYCVEGKGRDLQGVVHEWGGPPEAVAALLRGLAAGIATPLAVLGPDSETPPLDGESALHSMAMLRILRPEAFGSDDPRQVFGDAGTPARIPLYVWGLDSV